MKALVILLLSFNAYSQSAQEIFEQMRKERAKMFEDISRMMQEDSFFNGSSFGSKGLGFSSTNSSIQVDKIQEEDGSISVLIKPQNKNILLDIKTNGDSITVKAETKVEETNEDENNKSSFFSSSSSTQIISIPHGYTAKDPVEIEDGIKISLVPGSKSKKLKKNDDRMPIGKMPGEETI